MTIVFTGNMICKYATQLQIKGLLIPWVKNNIVVRCGSKGRDCSSSSFPVRYIPKIPSQSCEESESACSVEKHFDDKEKKATTSTTRSVDLNNIQRLVKSSGTGKSLSRTTATNTRFKNPQPLPFVNFDVGLVEQEVESLSEEHTDERHRVQAHKNKQDVENSAVELLAARAYTVAELKKKLQGKKFPHDVVDEVVTNFQVRGLINDSLYAETFARSRWSSLSWGPRRIKQALFKKGVKEMDADHAIKLVFEDAEQSEPESKVGTSKLSMNHLFVQASKQWLRGGDVPREKRKSRIVRWLQYRGFNWSVINGVLKKLETEYPP